MNQETLRNSTESDFSRTAFIKSSAPICALASAQGLAALALIRVSGDDCWQMTRSCLPFLFKRKSAGGTEGPESHRVYFGKIVDADLEPIDEVLVTTFAKGRSFTGEESLEISCHGSEQVVRAILLRLNELGIRSAQPGEFSFRAYRNGRIDLVQAEAVLSLIHSRTSAGTRVALSQLGGALSERYREIESNLNWLAAQLEAQIDFSSEGLDYADDIRFLERLGGIEQSLRELVRTGASGRLLSGLNVALVGKVNVGKSSLFNVLCGFERAIVSIEPGTTRDYIETEICYEGFFLRLTDTAGIRTSDSDVENIGIRAGKKQSELADVRLRVIDCMAADWADELEAFLKRHQVRENSDSEDREFFVLNKIDLDRDGVVRGQLAEKLSRFEGKSPRVFTVSASTYEGVDLMLKELVAPLRQASLEAGTVVTQVRQLEELQRIAKSVELTRTAKTNGVSPEIVAFELRPALEACQRLLGTALHEQVIDRVFKEFCLGK